MMGGCACSPASSPAAACGRAGGDRRHLRIDRVLEDDLDLGGPSRLRRPAQSDLQVAAGCDQVVEVRLNSMGGHPAISLSLAAITRPTVRYPNLASSDSRSRRMSSAVRCSVSSYTARICEASDSRSGSAHACRQFTARRERHLRDLHLATAIVVDAHALLGTEARRHLERDRPRPGVVVEEVALAAP